MKKMIMCISVSLETYQLLTKIKKRLGIPFSQQFEKAFLEYSKKLLNKK